MTKFKINKTDIMLAIGFVLGCFLISYLAWSLNVQLEQARTYSSGIVWTNTGTTCYANGKSWPAINHICYMEDAR